MAGSGGIGLCIQNRTGVNLNQINNDEGGIIMTNSLPYGVVRFYYPDADISQRVPYMTRDEMEEAIIYVLNSGFRPDNMICWVWNESSANRLFTIMDNYGYGRSRIFGLTVGNLSDVLDEMVITIHI